MALYQDLTHLAQAMMYMSQHMHLPAQSIRNTLIGTLIAGANGCLQVRCEECAKV